MNRVQRFLLNTAARFVPQLRRLFATAGGTIESLHAELEALRYRNDDRRMLVEREMIDIREAIALAAGPWKGSAQGVLLHESARGPAVTVLKERLAELELALEDRGWRRELAIGETEFSRYGIQQLILISRLYFIKNPLVRRGVSVSAHYVFGRGFEISADDETANAVLQEFLSDDRNAAEIGQTGLVRKEESLHTDGNIFVVLFSDVATGRVVLRTIDALEIDEIITDPDDKEVKQYFRRRWSSQIFDVQTGTTKPSFDEAWYPALGYDPPSKPAMIGGKPCHWDEPVMHIPVGGLPKWHFGCPLVYPALDWARSYRHFLEDWCTLTRALARFAWGVETKGGQQAIASLKQALATTLGNDGSAIEQNPPATMASTWITGTGNKMSPMRTAGATTEPEQGRRVMLMVAAAFGLPETFFGDASTGSLATAQSLDRPTELKFLERQEHWRSELIKLCRAVLERSGSAAKGALREAGKVAKKVTIKVDFPSVLEHDIAKRVNAIVAAMTLNGYEALGIDEKTGVGMLLAELGVENVQVVLDTMYPEGKYEPDRTIEPEPTPTPAPGAPPNGGPPQRDVKRGQPAKEAIDAAVIELQRAVLRMKERSLGTNGH